MSYYSNKFRLLFIVILFTILSCSNNNSEQTEYHFTKKEMSDLNKIGKVVKVNSEGIEKVFINDDKYDANTEKKNLNRNIKQTDGSADA